MFLLTPGGNAHGLNTLRIKELHHFRRRSIFLPKSPSWPRFGPFSAHSADQSAPRAAGARCSPAPKQRASPCWLSWRHSGPNRGRPDQPRVNLARLRLVQLLPAVLIGLLDNSCASGMPGGQVSSCPWACTRAPPFGRGDTRACFSHRIAKTGRLDPDIRSLRQSRALFRSRTLIGATFCFHHRPLERSQRLERMGKFPAQLLRGQPHPDWFNRLGWNRFQRPRAGYRSDDRTNPHGRCMGTVRTVTWITQDLNHADLFTLCAAMPTSPKPWR